VFLHAGTQLFQNKTVDIDKHRMMMINFVVPSVLTEFPDAEHNRHPEIVIQQDGAPAHINPRDEELMQCLTDMGLVDKIKLVTQPANSPDLNVNDLGFFNALKSMHCCTTPPNEVELTAMVEKTFTECPMNKINRIGCHCKLCSTTH